jgi:Uncharacterised nucleotidyltransferase
MPPLDSPTPTKAARSPDSEKFAFSPEFQLLLACSVSGKESDGRRMRAEASLNWSHVLRLAEHHNVIPLVYQALRQIPDEVPPAILDELRTRFDHNARKNLRFAAELTRILECLESHGIAAVPFKGPVLAEAVYGNLALREFSDLDIFVQPANFLRAKETLRSLGYAPGWQLSAVEESAYLATGYECSFDGPAGRNLLELHWGVLPAFYAVDFDIEGFFQRAACNKFGDGTVKTLSQPDLLLTLCVHAAKHAWIRLCWLRDIAGVSRSPSFAWNAVWRQARDLGIERIVRISLLLANRLLAANIPHMEKRRDDAEIEALCERIARDMPESEQYSTESLRYFRLMLQLRERRSDRLRFALRLLFTPSVGEWSVVRLPAPLFPLYRVIRLFRVAGRFLHFGETRNGVHESSAE